NRSVKIILVGVGITLFVLLRVFEETLFYDPLLPFFKTVHTTSSLPTMPVATVIGHVMLRFLLNSVVSLAIIWALFQSKDILKFSIVLYIILGVVGVSLFYFLIQTSDAGDHLYLFYVRRFLIQPLFLFLLVPAFYVQRIRQKAS
ncbi:MAG: exosortase F system-associated protein, partial [Marinirhabdus sp.]|nr:exosortase F system-associated protein [Marinirhabdus sp.]